VGPGTRKRTGARSRLLPAQTLVSIAA
jgi:hypothetical protein